MSTADAALAVRAAQAGAAVVAAHFGTSLTRFDQTGGDFATSADLAAEQAVLEVLRAARPDDVVQGEESGKSGTDGNGRTWLVDPLCGTLNLGRELPLRTGGQHLLHEDVVLSAGRSPAGLRSGPKNTGSGALARCSAYRWLCGPEPGSFIPMLHRRQPSPPPVRRSRIPVQEDDRVTGAVLAVRHFQAADGDPALRNGHRRIACAADGRHAYVADEGDSTITVLNVGTGRVTATIRVGRSPRSVAVAPDGRHAYVSAGEVDAVTVLRVAAR